MWYFLFITIISKLWKIEKQLQLWILAVFLWCCKISICTVSVNGANKREMAHFYGADVLWMFESIGCFAGIDNKIDNESVYLFMIVPSNWVKYVPSDCHSDVHSCVACDHLEVCYAALTLPNNWQQWLQWSTWPEPCESRAQKCTLNSDSI